MRPENVSDCAEKRPDPPANFLAAPAPDPDFQVLSDLELFVHALYVHVRSLVKRDLVQEFHMALLTMVLAEYQQGLCMFQSDARSNISIIAFHCFSFQRFSLPTILLPYGYIIGFSLHLYILHWQATSACRGALSFHLRQLSAIRSQAIRPSALTGCEPYSTSTSHYICPPAAYNNAATTHLLPPLSHAAIRAL